jgi:glycosylphosphatidylinositol transamidase (GPIT) subunit GPI8
MTEKSIKFRDPVVERVVDKFISRSDVGYKKYGVTLEQDQSRIFEWLNHLQEELMDAVLYLQKAKEVYSEDLMDAIVRRIEKNEED